MTDTFDDPNNNNNKRPINMGIVLLWTATILPIAIPLLAHLIVNKNAVIVKVSALLASWMPSISKYLYTSHTYVF